MYIILGVVFLSHSFFLSFCISFVGIESCSRHEFVYNSTSCIMAIWLAIDNNLRFGFWLFEMSAFPILFLVTPSNGKRNGIKAGKKTATATKRKRINSLQTNRILFKIAFNWVLVFSSLIFFCPFICLLLCFFFWYSVSVCTVYQYRCDWTMIKSSYSNSLTLSLSLSFIHFGKFLFFFLHRNSSSI